MEREHNRNRELLARLIFRTRTFTEGELVQKCRLLPRGSADLGPLGTIGDYLESLRNLGALGFERGRYFLLRQKPRLS